MSGACHTTRSTPCCVKMYSIADSVVAHAPRRVRAGRRAPHRRGRAAAAVSRSQKQSTPYKDAAHDAVFMYLFLLV